MKVTFCLLFQVAIAGILPLSAQPVTPTPPFNLPDLQDRVAKGDPEAELELGRAYYTGKGVPRNFPKAADLYRKAADQGEAKAMFNLGHMYHFAEGFPEDDASALQWYEKAAGKGLPRAQLVIGLAYYHGDLGMNKDYAAALKWLMLAANQTIEPEPARMAANALGVLYENGWGVPKDGQKAIAFWEQAANAGDPKAKGNLGRAYQENLIVKEDPVKSYMWLKLGAFQEDPEALHLISEDLAIKRFTPEQMAEGDRLARDFQIQHHGKPLNGPIPVVAEPSTLSLFKQPPATTAATNSPTGK